MPIDTNKAILHKAQAQSIRRAIYARYPSAIIYSIRFSTAYSTFGWRIVYCPSPGATIMLFNAGEYEHALKTFSAADPESSEDQGEKS
jgi:hypothetical protein